MLDRPTIIVSVSGGKDSTACAIIALRQHDPDRVRLVFADTGHEHPATIEYLDYLSVRLNAPITTVRADFAADIARKRRYITEKWAADLVKDVPGEWSIRPEFFDGDENEDGEMVVAECVPEQFPPPPANLYLPAINTYFRWKPARKGLSQAEAEVVVERALSVLHPTGIPFLDLCMMKGRFPSRKAQFCTQELKRRPMDGHMLDLLAEGRPVESWQGVRRDESRNRRDALKVERAAEGWLIRRPIVHWTAQQTVDFIRRAGVELNPLYRQGCSRVGCMPCINVAKDELAEIARRWPAEIARVWEWERLVGMASKRGSSSLLHHADGEGGTAEQAFAASNIHAMVKWSRTSRGGRQFDWLRMAPPAECASSYGLCE